MSKQEIFEKVKEEITIMYGPDLPEITERSTFGEDIGLDSLDHVEFIIKMEDLFAVRIQDEDAYNLVNVGNVGLYC